MNGQELASLSTKTALSALREPDRFLQETITTARANLDRYVGDATAYAQRQPVKALLFATAVGYVLHMLPLGGIMRMLIRIAVALVKPLAFIYGGAKLWEKVQNSAQSHPTQESP